MLVVDVYTLILVHSLHFSQEVFINALYSEQSHDVVRIERSLGDLTARLDLLSHLDVDPCSERYDVIALAALFLNDDVGLVVFSRLDRGNDSVALADLSKTLRLTRLEELLYSRETLSDVGTGNAARVERSHGQLCTRLTDGLCGDDAYSLTLLHESARGHVLAVALSAETCLGSACHGGSDHYGLDAALFDLVCHVIRDVLVGSQNDFARSRIDYVFARVSARDTEAQLLDLFLAVSERSGFDAFGRSAVLFIDDDAVRDIYKTSCQISGVGCSQSRIGKSLTGSVG